jgi:protein SCO1/2
MRSSLPIVLVAFAAAIAGWLVARHSGETAPEDLSATVLAEPRAVPEFALVDEHGDAIAREDLKGAWTLAFFGFTHCPDVCPMTLHTLSAATRSLAEDGAPVTPRVVLFSVDPERDTPEALERYLAYFDGEFTGVTGSEAAVAEFTRELGIAYVKRELDDGDYTIDHTAAVFLLDPQARLAAIFRAPHDPERIADEVVAIADMRS